MIAIDAMGGDFAPHAVIQAALIVARKGISVILTGHEEKLSKYLTQSDATWKSLPIQLLHSPDAIGMAEEPVIAVRRKPNSSMVRAVQLVSDGKATAVVSAGNSGALMAASLFILGREVGIDRPAIAGVIPTLKGKVITLDLGANVECRPHYLVQFAHMGAEYAKALFNLKKPRIALLSNGVERGKGTTLVKQTAALLEDSPLNFIGNIEPHDIMHHHTDVVVCDGFSGNVFLKTMEATSYMLKHSLAQHFSAGGVSRNSDLQRIGEQALEHLDAVFDYEQQGAARLLGVNGVVLVAHGNADAQLLANAIVTAHNITSK